MSGRLIAIREYLATAGCAFPQIDLLQPADPFLDTTGEDLRRRIFITQENSGTLFCLRPEFTIPVGLYHLAGGAGAARYGYSGQVFRQRRDGPSEFTQAGFEDLGSPDKSAADIATVKAAMGVLEACGIDDGHLVLGDESVFVALMEALEIPEAWRKKLVRSFGDNAMLEDHIRQMADGGKGLIENVPAAVADCLVAGDRKGLVNVIADQMLSDSLPLSGGRTPVAIAERMMEKAELASSCLRADQQAALEDFLALDVDLREAPAALHRFCTRHGLSMQASLDALAALIDGLDGAVGNSVYRASFGRRLDYYTGLVFEIFRKDAGRPVIGGGRYDRLMTLLGSPEEMPAVGFAIWVDRLGDEQ